MDSNTEANKFGIHEVLKGRISPDHTYGGEVDTWESIRPGLGFFDVQSPETSIPSHVIYAGKVESWTRITEERRWTLTCWVMGLLAAWILVGLIVVIINGNVWLLTSVGVLALPIKKVFDYYFHQSKK